MPAISTSGRGSEWHRWDLHFHTPSSFDHLNKANTNSQIVDGLVAAGVRVVAISDHHRIDVTRIRDLQSIAGDRLTVLPAIELRSELGTKPIHYICIFPEDCDLDHVWETFKGALGLTPTAIRQKGGDEAIYVPIKDGAALAHDLGGLASIHAGVKSNSLEEIDNAEIFQRRIKYDIAKDHVDLLEIGQIKDIDSHYKVIFPTTGLDLPLVTGSDNHDISTYSVRAPLWIRADPTFRGLRMLVREPRERLFIGAAPPEVTRAAQNPTKYIRSINFARRPQAPPSEQWFSGDIDFNHGLVAIIGNKGSGKSALADTLGLLGGTRNSASFSFLSTKRFRHPTSGLAQHFNATLIWESGEPVVKSLEDEVRPEEVERLKYLPQDHLERVCNEITGPGKEGFEQELKSVIFSHVEPTQRLSFENFDDLVRFQTGEKQKRIDSLLRQLREVSRTRADLETRADPLVRQRLQEKSAQRQRELEAHDAARPPEVPDPSASGYTPGPEQKGLLEALSKAQTTKEGLDQQLGAASETLRAAERQHAVAKRLLEKLENFEKEIELFQQSLIEDAVELALSAADLVSVTIDKTGPTAKRGEAAELLRATRDRIDNKDAGLRKQIHDAEATIQALQAQLDSPSRAYQAYLASLAEWQSRRNGIEGSAEDPESLRGLQAALAALDELPASIDAAKTRQAELARQIHSEKLAQAEIYRTLYGSVQDFIDSHALAKDRLKLEFRAELTTNAFPNRLLSFLALNRRGSFMGIDEGRARAEALLQPIDWESPDAAQSFLESVDNALHFDQRDGQNVPVLLNDQLLKAQGTKAEDVYDFLYGLEYVRPHYLLRWEGKDLSMLSPGERGTLLLVFYLLVDKSDGPLIIDQPEGNLDNHTVAKVLVDCIKEARKRRQVFIVTHNPNLAVVCDADQVVHAGMDKANGNRITYTSGSLENPAISQLITDVLEGTRWAFGVRDNKYRVGEQDLPVGANGTK